MSDPVFVPITHNPILADVSEVYEFEDIIGSGGFSDVVSAFHKEKGHKRAIKIIDKEKIKTERQKQRIVTEVDILRICSEHPYVLKLYEVYESNLDICLVLELMEGGELFEQIVRQVRLSEANAIRITRQIVSVVQFLHDKGICHRDLKPENILCTSKDTNKTDIRVTDFGLAKFGKDSLETPCGTLNYVAPEVVTADVYDNMVDMWSLGCTLYFLLFGQPPFYTKEDDEDEDLLMEKVREGEFSFPKPFSGGPAVSDLAKDFVAGLLEKDPRKRISTTEAMAHAWMGDEGAFLKQSRELSAVERRESTLRKSMDKAELNESQKSLRESINKAVDVQRDGMFLKPVSESTIAKRRRAKMAANGK